MKEVRPDDAIFKVGDVLTLRGRRVEVLEGGDYINYIEVRYLEDGTEGIIVSQKLSDTYTEKLEQDYKRRKFGTKVLDADHTVKEVRKAPIGSYIYFVRCEGKIVYIGSGKGFRYAHTTGGTSSSFYLNKLFFEGKELEVTIEKEGLSKEESLEIERTLIKQYTPEGNTQHSKKSTFNGSRTSLSASSSYMLMTNIN